MWLALDATLCCSDLKFKKYFTRMSTNKQPFIYFIKRANKNVMLMGTCRSMSGLRTLVFKK